MNILKNKEEFQKGFNTFIRETYVSDKTGRTSVVEYQKPVESNKPMDYVGSEPTESEIAQAEMLLMQTEIIANQNAQDEVLAEILLNQIGGLIE